MDELRLGHLSLARLRLETSSDNYGRARNLRKVLAHCILYERMCDVLSAKVDNQEAANRRRQRTRTAASRIFRSTRAEVKVDTVEVDSDSDSESCSSDDGEGISDLTSDSSSETMAGKAESWTDFSTISTREDPFWSWLDAQAELYETEETKGKSEAAEMDTILDRWVEDDPDSNDASLQLERSPSRRAESGPGDTTAATEAEEDITDQARMSKSTRTQSRTEEDSCLVRDPERHSASVSDNSQAESPSSDTQQHHTPLPDPDPQSTSTARSPTETNPTPTRPPLPSRLSTGTLSTIGLTVTLSRPRPELEKKDNMTLGQWWSIVPGMVSCFAASLRDEMGST